MNNTSKQEKVKTLINERRLLQMQKKDVSTKMSNLFSAKKSITFLIKENIESNISNKLLNTINENIQDLINRKEEIYSKLDNISLELKELKATSN